MATAQQWAMEIIRRIGGSLTFRHQMMGGKYDGKSEPLGRQWLMDCLG